MKKYLFIVDPQNDFIEGGTLAIPGGKEALQRIVDSGILTREDWEGIFVTLDSHNPTHLGFGEPKTELRKFLVEDTPRPTKWPPHCIVDTHGWEIYKPLQDKLLELVREGKAEFVMKGVKDNTDSYSILEETYGEVEYGDINPMVEDMIYLIFQDIQELENPGEIEIYWTGLAEDYCVYESIKSFMKIDLGDDIKHILLSDMTSPLEKHINDENISITPYRS